jgi:hypothetical protein
MESFTVYASVLKKSWCLGVGGNGGMLYTPQHFYGWTNVGICKRTDLSARIKFLIFDILFRIFRLKTFSILIYVSNSKFI